MDPSLLQPLAGTITHMKEAMLRQEPQLWENADYTPVTNFKSAPPSTVYSRYCCLGTYFL
jgi:hypothetical protein